MSTSLEAWAEAVALDQEFGEAADMHIAEKIGQHIMAGETAETARWHRVSLALEAFRQATKQ